MNFLANSIVKALDKKFEAQKQEKEFTQDEQDQMMIAEYEERKQAILASNIPAFFGPDPSIF